MEEKTKKYRVSRTYSMSPVVLSKLVEAEDPERASELANPELTEQENELDWEEEEVTMQEECEEMEESK